MGRKFDFEESEETVLREIIANELYLEVNTKDLKKFIDRPYQADG